MIFYFSGTGNSEYTAKKNSSRDRRQDVFYKIRNHVKEDTEDRA